MKKEYISVKLGELNPYENNPRKNDEAVPDVHESIDQVGYITPIIIDENNVILTGHTRLKALKIDHTNDYEIDVLRVTGLSKEKKQKFRLLDNKTSEKSGWDFTILEKELADLDFGDFDFGFDIDINEEEFSDYFTTAPTNTDNQNNKTSTEPQNHPVDEIPTFENYTKQELGQEEVNKQRQIQCPHCKMWFTL